MVGLVLVVLDGGGGMKQHRQTARPVCAMAAVTGEGHLKITITCFYQSATIGTPFFRVPCCKV